MRGLCTTTFSSRCSCSRTNSSDVCSVTIVDSLSDGDETRFSNAVLERYGLPNEQVVDCWAWQATKIRRARGQTVKSKDPKGSFYQVELDNDMRLRMAIWHEHWARFPPASPPDYHASYWEAYSSGNKVSLPACEDIRGQAPAPPQKPQQLSMF